jgi:lysophospholipase L1-like esterase
MEEMRRRFYRQEARREKGFSPMIIDADNNFQESCYTMRIEPEEHSPFRVLRHPFWKFPGWFLIALTSLNATDSATGVGLWCAFAVYPVAVVFFVLELFRLLGVNLFRAGVLLTLLVYQSIAACFIAGEFGLAAYEKLSPAHVLTMPVALELRQAPGGFYWQGIFHAKDERGFRKIGDWPVKGERFRIAVFGDSLTYGLGVDERETYPADLQRALGDDRFEVMNLGIVGLNSTQILSLMKEMIPKLHPDLVIYGVCLNDLLPKERAQEKADQAYAFPIPVSIRDPLLTRTRLGKALDIGYSKLLLSLRLRQDFIHDILDNIDENRRRFRGEVGEMDVLIEKAGLPPLIGMVLEQYPQVFSPSWQVAKEIEQAMRISGISVVPSDDYYQKYNGRSMPVSPWEGHPSAEAHGIFAERLAAFLREKKIWNS